MQNDSALFMVEPSWKKTRAIPTIAPRTLLSHGRELLKAGADIGNSAPNFTSTAGAGGVASVVSALAMNNAPVRSSNVSVHNLSAPSPAPSSSSASSATGGTETAIQQVQRLLQLAGQLPGVSGLTPVAASPAASAGLETTRPSSQHYHLQQQQQPQHQPQHQQHRQHQQQQQPSFTSSGPNPQTTFHGRQGGDALRNDLLALLAAAAAPSTSSATAASVTAVAAPAGTIAAPSSFNALSPQLSSGLVRRDVVGPAGAATPDGGLPPHYSVRGGGGGTMARLPIAFDASRQPQSPAQGQLPSSLSSLPPETLELYLNGLMRAPQPAHSTTQTSRPSSLTPASTTFDSMAGRAAPGSSHPVPGQAGVDEILKRLLSSTTPAPATAAPQSRLPGLPSVGTHRPLSTSPQGLTRDEALLLEKLTAMGGRDRLSGAAGTGNTGIRTGAGYNTPHLDVAALIEQEMNKNALETPLLGLNTALSRPTGGSTNRPDLAFGGESGRLSQLGRHSIPAPGNTPSFLDSTTSAQLSALRFSRTGQSDIAMPSMSGSNNKAPPATLAGKTTTTNRFQEGIKPAGGLAALAAASRQMDLAAGAGPLTRNSVTSTTPAGNHDRLLLHRLEQAMAVPKTHFPTYNPFLAQEARGPTAETAGVLGRPGIFGSGQPKRSATSLMEPFPEKLHRLLREVEAAGLASIISFTGDGKAFEIHKPDRFFHEIVPQYFKQSRLSSFKRQLNLYGFELITSGCSRGGYYHEHFQRDEPALCRQIRRRDVRFPAKATKKWHSNAPDFYNMPPIVQTKKRDGKTKNDKDSEDGQSDEDQDDRTRDGSEQDESSQHGNNNNDDDDEGKDNNDAAKRDHRICEDDDEKKASIKSSTSRQKEGDEHRKDGGVDPDDQVARSKDDTSGGTGNDLKNNRTTEDDDDGGAHKNKKQRLH